MVTPLIAPTRTPISVVIRTQNNLATLPRVIARLGLLPGDELLAVDSGSTDGTSEFITATGGRVVPWTDGFHLVRTINRGLAEARSPWVLILSSHSIAFAPSLLATYREAIPHFPATTFAAYGPSLWIARHWQPQQGLTHHDYASFHRNHVNAGNSNLLLKRSAWEDFPFDDRHPCEDQHWMNAHLKLGRTLTHVHAAATLYGSMRPPAHLFRKGRLEFLDNQKVLHLPPPRLYNLIRQAARLSLWVSSAQISPGRALRAMAYSLGHWSGGRAWERQEREKPAQASTATTGTPPVG